LGKFQKTLLRGFREGKVKGRRENDRKNLTLGMHETELKSLVTFTGTDSRAREKLAGGHNGVQKKRRNS